MANKSVYLVRKCKTTDGWKRYPVVMSANGKVKTDTVKVKGVEVTYPVGHYELGSYLGSKRVWTRVEGNATDALAALKLAQKRANAVAIAGDADVKVLLDPTRITLKVALRKYKEAAEARGAMEVAEVVDRAVGELILTCPKMYVDQLDREDITRFHAAMRKRGLGDRTISNRHANLRSFLLFAGADADAICGPSPKYEKLAVEIFEPSDLEPFFAADMSEYDRLIFGLLLAAGLREREAMHLEWRSINWTAKTLKVQSNARHKFKVKDSEQRNIAIPGDLVERLRVYRDSGRPEHRLVFGKLGGTVDEPEGHFLRRLKAIVRRSGLNCGDCRTCIDRQECERWYLHKFRATYVTTLLRGGLDLRTVMQMSGHSDMESVMRYLRPAEGKRVQEAVNAIKWC